MVVGGGRWTQNGSPMVPATVGRGVVDHRAAELNCEHARYIGMWAVLNWRPDQIYLSSNRPREPSILGPLQQGSFQGGTLQKMYGKNRIGVCTYK